MNLFIGYTKYGYSKGFCIGCPFRIVFPCVLIIVLATVNFYNEFEYRAIKIDDIISKHILTIKFISTISKKIIP